MIPERLSAALADRYRIERELGQGGMATVYLAEDLKHKRQVAVKVLKPELAAVLGADRFVQEITTTAALQHPHILPLFDSGTAHGFLYYVMPFIDGETLRAKLDRETQLSVDEAVRIARDVADALDYAHSKGVVHRDIKPENILLANGRPMVADFGIALAVSAAAGGRMTETGLSLGTPHYMSPEQATADKDITARSDIYSLGSVLYEMLTGNPPHTGASAQQIIMKIVTEDAAPVTRYRKSVAPNVAAAVAKSLEKLPADRFASAKEFAEALGNSSYVGSGSTGFGSAAHDSAWKRRAYVGAAAAVVLLLIVGALVARQSSLSSRSATPASAIHVRLALQSGDRIAVKQTDGNSNADRPVRTAFAFSPDGKSLVIGIERDHHQQLFLRSLASEAESPIPGTENGETPFFSPDGKSLGFWSDGTLRRVLLNGGPPIDIATVGRIIGASWSDDDRIAVGGRNGLIIYSVAGARPDTIREGGAIFPQWLPGSKAILYTKLMQNPTSASGAAPRVQVISPEGGAARTLVEDGADARIVETGQLIFARNGTLMAVPFDVQRVEVRGAAITLFPDVMQALNGANNGVRIASAQFAISRAGNLAWIPGGISPDRPGNVVWVDRHGTVAPIAALEERQYQTVRLSPDEKRIAIAVYGSKPSFHVFDIARQSSQTLLNKGHPSWALWTPDGRTLFRSGLVHDTLAIVSSLADDSRPATPLKGAAFEGFPAFLSPDGSELFAIRSGSGLSGITLATGATRPIANLPSDIRFPALSPDARWLAYSAAPTGGDADVFVQPWPALDRKWKVSTRGGTAPAWTKAGRELLYLEPGKLDSVGHRPSVMMSVVLTPGNDFTAGIPHELFRGVFGTVSPLRGWDVTADGSRFVAAITRPVHSPPGDIHVLINWLEAFPELLRSGRR